MTYEEKLKMVEDFLDKARELQEQLVIGNEVSSPTDIYRVVRPYYRKDREEVLVVGLDTSHKVLYVDSVSVGTLDKALVFPREVYRKAISANASVIALAHNHPSGRVEMSDEDRDLTRRIKQAGEVLGIKLIDHLSYSLEGYYSALEHGVF